MSMDQLDRVAHNCFLQSRWKQKPPLNEISLAAAVIQLQQEACYEELGDEIRRDDGLIKEARVIAGDKVGVADQSALTLCSAIEQCLKDRYMGICSTSASCDGAQNFVNLLAMIGPVEAEA